MGRKIQVMTKVRYDSKVFYFYFKKVMKELRKQNWARENRIYIPYTVSFNTTSIAYNHDAFVLLQKSFSRIGWKLKMKQYSYVPSIGAEFKIVVEKM